MELLKIENLTKIYGSGENEVRALDGVSFSVEKGERVLEMSKIWPETRHFPDLRPCNIT